MQIISASAPQQDEEQPTVSLPRGWFCRRLQAIDRALLLCVVRHQLTETPPPIGLLR